FSLDPMTIEVREDAVDDLNAEGELVPLGGEVAELILAYARFAFLENALDMVLDEVGELVVELGPDEVRIVLSVCSLKLCLLITD
ncbi:hypothetical protein PMAYCL1PPCAC_13860, partial [Pristionchus mayeri]